MPILPRFPPNSCSSLLLLGSYRSASSSSRVANNNNMWCYTLATANTTTILSRRSTSTAASSVVAPQQQQMQRQKVALVMGVANHRSIAWACVESFRRQNFRVILTYQQQNDSSDSKKRAASMDKLLATLDDTGGGSVHALPCNVETDIPRLFQEQIPDLLLDQGHTHNNNSGVLDAIVHSIAYAPFGDNNHNSNNNKAISEASLADFQTAHHISTYSLLETAKHAKSIMHSSTTAAADTAGGGGASITALTYLGANRAVPNYYLMGPAKASLEACVRGLAVELGSFELARAATESKDDNDKASQTTTTNHHHSIRVNAVSAGPLRTLSSRGIPQFTDLWQHVQDKAPLQRNVTHQEVADTVRFLATEGTGMTGQVLYVDAGYSSVVPV